MYSGRNQLIKRLAYQLGSEKAALSILKQRGHLSEDGELTPEGMKRDNMSAAERAKDRHKSSSLLLQYSPVTNRATLIRPNLRAKKL